MRAATVRAVGFALAAVATLAGAIHFANLTADDVFISIRYAENFASGHGLVYNVGERVEGYSNPLWTLLLAVPAALGASRFDTGMLAATKLLSLLCALLAVAFTTWHEPLGSRSRWAALPVGSLLLGTNLAFSMWAAGGLETTLLALLLTGCAISWVRERAAADAPARIEWSALWLAAAALTRPEPVALFAPIFALRLLAWPRPFWRHARAHVRYAVTFALPCLAWLLFRLAYYGAPLPNTYYAKREGDVTALARGLTYTSEALNGLNLVPIVVLSVLLLSLRRSERARTLLLVALCAALTFFAVWEGGDWMRGHRLFVPALPLVALLVSSAWRVATELRPEDFRLPAVPAWVLRPAWRDAWNLALPYLGPRHLLVLRGAAGGALLWAIGVGQARSFTDWVGEQGSGFTGIRLDSGSPYADARWMRVHVPKGALLATGEAGIVPYYTQARLIDLNGLVDAHIARLPGGRHHKFDLGYVLGRNPDYVYLLVDEAPDGTLVSRTYYGRELLSRPEFHARYRRVKLFYQSVLFARR
jgi:arabinofuranosyltransferase